MNRRLHSLHSRRSKRTEPFETKVKGLAKRPGLASVKMADDRWSVVSGTTRDVALRSNH